MKKVGILLVGLSGVASIAVAQDATLYPENTTIKGYAKRDRVLLGSEGYVSPTQLHEIKDYRIEVGAESTQSKLKNSDTGYDSTISAPVGTLMAAYGNDHWAFGLDASYLSARNDSSGVVNAVDEKFQSTKVIPQVAYTFGQNVTLGVGGEFNWLKDSDSDNEKSFEYQLGRGLAGLALHTEKMEIGLAYAGEVQASDTLANGESRAVTTFAAVNTSANTEERAVYLPAETTVYARGNLADNISLMGVATMARYDGNVDGAIALFDDYKSEDRLAGKLIGTYWTEGRSRVSLAAEYKGGATTAVGSDEAGLGYRLANTFGGTIEGVMSLDRKTYIGLLAGYSAGARDDKADDGTVYKADESATKIAGMVAVKF